MSSLIVPIAEIESISEHSNADTLELAKVLGWQLVVRKGTYKVGDKIVYIPIDSILPFELSERLGVTKYLSKQRIKCTKLRGEPSFGLAIIPEHDTWAIGEDVAAYYGIEKYEPPLRINVGDSEKSNPLFCEYTDIENMRNFPTIFEENEMVILSEKIHGCNSRVGIVNGEFMAGSKAVQRQRPENDDFLSSLYWFPFSLEPVRSLLEELGSCYKQVVLFGEIYGSKIQSFHYGKKGTLGYRAFDLLIDGKYVDWVSFLKLCEKYTIDTVPIIDMLPFNLNKIKQLSEGKTLLMQEEQHIREGVVVRPFYERHHQRIGRVILKYVSDSYLFGEKTDFTDK